MMLGDSIVVYFNLTGYNFSRLSKIIIFFVFKCQLTELHLARSSMKFSLEINSLALSL
jgi:hypothetical protein